MINIFIFLIFAVLQVCGSSSNTSIQISYVWSPQTCVRSVKEGDFVRYHYYGLLSNGKYFDSSYIRGSTYNVYVGSGFLIKGMDLGLVGMCVNEHRLITIPPHLAYGDKKTDNEAIPANSTLIFNVILVDVWNDQDEVKVSVIFKPPNCKRQIKDSDFVRYHYNGTLLNGKIFHSSYENKQTYDTYVGQGWLIKGMDIGLIGACMGERRHILIPPHMAYGERGDGKNIPRFASVAFDVEIVDFHNPKDDVDIKYRYIKSSKKCVRHLKESDFVRYHYNGTLVDGTLFDSSYRRNHTYNTYVGHRRIIPGMEKGLLGSCMGEWRSITIPPHLGYGEQGVDGVIPGSAVLVFHVYVVDFHNPNDDIQIEVLSRPDSCNRDSVHKVVEGDYVKYNFVVRLMDGSVLESSFKKSESMSSYIGKGDLPSGVEKGLVGMCEGEVRRLVVPPHMGYGEAGQGVVPGSAVLDFTFELLKVAAAPINDEVTFPYRQNFLWLVKEDDFYNDMDAGDNQTVTFEEFSSYLSEQVEMSRARFLPGVPRDEVVLELFKNRDKDGDGKLSHDELSTGIDPERGVTANDEL